jgi:hypothetical protein
MWEVKMLPYGDAQVEELLGLGWEPFAATPGPISQDSLGRTRILNFVWLRRYIN